MTIIRRGQLATVYIEGVPLHCTNWEVTPLEVEERAASSVVSLANLADMQMVRLRAESRPVKAQKIKVKKSADRLAPWWKRFDR